MDRRIAQVFCRLEERLGRQLKDSPLWSQFRLSWPGWEVRFSHDLRARHVVDWDDEIIWVRAWAADPMLEVAHAAGHLLFHAETTAPTDDEFTEAEEAEADRFARCWTATPVRQWDDLSDQIA